MASGGWGRISARNDKIPVMAEASTVRGMRDSKSDNNDQTAAAAVVAVVVAEDEEVSTPDVSAYRGLYPRMVGGCHRQETQAVYVYHTHLE